MKSGKKKKITHGVTKLFSWSLCMKELKHKIQTDPIYRYFIIIDLIVNELQCMMFHLKKVVCVNFSQNVLSKYF